MAIAVEPPRYQSQDISFSDWITLLTLCFAPLIAHIFSGAPSPSILVPARPRWHDYVVLFNPTAIIYRYGAIVDRRIRAYKWELVDVAAANALFWTAHGWDGSENMVTSSLPCCALLPDSTTMNVLSVSMLKTIITTLQGVQAAVGLAGAMAGTLSEIPDQPGLDFAFGPLAVLGLLRLVASTWLSDDFAYSSVTSGATSIMMQEIPQTRQRGMSCDSLLQDCRSHMVTELRYRPRSFWPSRIFRLLFSTILLAAWTLALCWTLIPDKVLGRSLSNTTTTFVQTVFYFITFSATAIIYLWYSVQGQATSTILPCVSRPWFKVYSILWMLFAAILVILSSIETHKTRCGLYSTISIEASNAVCSSHATKS